MSKTRKFLTPILAGLAVAIAAASMPATAEANPYKTGVVPKYHHVDRHWSPVYAVPARDYRRFVHRHGHRATQSREFRHWVVRHGRPVPRGRGHYHGWHGRGHDRGWILVDLRTGRIWR